MSLLFAVVNEYSSSRERGKETITAGHLGSWLESTPSCPALWLREAESTEWQLKVLNVPTGGCTHGLLDTVPGEEVGMEWNGAPHLLLRSWPWEVTKWSRPWTLEEGEGKNHCQVSVVVECLAKIWWITHWKLQPPSGTRAAVSSFPAL